MKKIPLVSIVLSFRNEEQVLPQLITRLQQVLRSLPIDYELVFVNDYSKDNSLRILREYAIKDARIKIVNMSRTFGVSECVLAGMKYAIGDAVIYMDADLQDPPEIIPDLIKKWEQGADVVHTVRTKREGESALKLALTDAAYKLIGLFSNIELTAEAGDFKLLSRRVVNELLQLKEATPYLRGLVNWVGFNQVNLSYERQGRAAGETKFPLFKNILHDMVSLRGPAGTLIVGITSFSLLLIFGLLFTGLIMCIGSFLVFLFLVIFELLYSGVPAWSVILSVLFFLSGIQLVGMGILGIFLGRIYQDVRGRPRYIIESIIGFERTKSETSLDDGR